MAPKSIQQTLPKNRGKMSPSLRSRFGNLVSNHMRSSKARSHSLPPAARKRVPSPNLSDNDRASTVSIIRDLTPSLLSSDVEASPDSCFNRNKLLSFGSRTLI
ncbi:hypothetical protein INT43_006899 [Umbelopsis isabellina]|uniref:Uncharacterized protein n=1 Tax=Mortierella isabellina TaxID=91625 RepID=A0A8H7UK85_MORIS|nr:hypothetical protein INT43_006899 [Umbelopsis isabellina]